MKHPLSDLIDARIREAEAKGAFEDLPGAGKPLPHVDLSENAVLGRVVREQGAVPPFVALSRELAALREELAETGDRTRRREIMTEMSMTEVRLDHARKAWSR